MSMNTFELSSDIIDNIDFTFPFQLESFEIYLRESKYLEESSCFPTIQANQYNKKPPRRVFIKDITNQHNLRRRVHRLPRLIKRDARRFYSFMLINAFNSGNEQFVERFLTTYLSPRCSIIFCDKEETKSIDSQGAVIIKTEIQLAYLKYPDIVFSIGESQKTEIYGKYDSQELLIKFPLYSSGTLLSQEMYQQITPLLQSIFQSIQSLSTISKSVEEIDVNDPNKYGMMTMSVDPLGYISCLHYDANSSTY